MPSCPCFGACGGKPGWRDPETGLSCTVCAGSGTFSYTTQAEHDAYEWEHFWKPWFEAQRTERRLRRRGASP